MSKNQNDLYELKVIFCFKLSIFLSSSIPLHLLYKHLYKMIKEQVFNGPRASFTIGQSKYAMFQSAERDSLGKL